MFAQVSVSGKVVDAGGIEMPGVNIAIKGTMVGTMTGADGTFTLSSIPGGKDAVLVFSFIGFRSQEVKVGNQTFINVKLELLLSVMERLGKKIFPAQFQMCR